MSANPHQDGAELVKRANRMAKDIKPLFSHRIIGDYSLFGSHISSKMGSRGVAALVNALDMFKPRFLANTQLERAYTGLVALFRELGPAQHLIAYLYLITDVIAKIPFFACKLISLSTSVVLTIARWYLLPEGLVRNFDAAIRYMRTIIAGCLPQQVFDVAAWLISAVDQAIQFYSP